MVHRTNLASAAYRAYSAGGSRSTVGGVDDSKLMQEMAGGIMSGEKRDSVESPQNYGFTSTVMDALKDKLGKMIPGGAAETFMSFMGGNRSFPVAGNMDDRRHRLTGLDKGDSAMFRTQGSKQQFHMSDDGGFWSAPQDKTMRMALLDEDSEKDGQQQSQGGGSSSGGGGGAAAASAGVSATATATATATAAVAEIPIINDQITNHSHVVTFDLEPSAATFDAGGGSATTFDTGGGGGSAGGAGGGQQKMKMGQKSLKDKNKKASRFIDVTKDSTRMAGKIVQLIMASGSGGGGGGGGGASQQAGSSGGGGSSGGSQDSGTVLAEASSDSKFYVGGTPKKGKYALVVTLKGPTINVPGRIG